MAKAKAIPEENREWTVMQQTLDGIALIEEMMKALKKPVNKKALEATKETVDVIKKQYKAMKKDESIRMQYQDKVAYSTIQLLFQVFHLAILSRVEENFIEDVIAHLQAADNVYTLSERIKAAAEARADFGPVRKGMM